MKEFFVYIHEKDQENISYIPHPELSEMLRRELNNKLEIFEKFEEISVPIISIDIKKQKQLENKEKKVLLNLIKEIK